MVAEGEQDGGILPVLPTFCANLAGAAGADPGLRMTVLEDRGPAGRAHNSISTRRPYLDIYDNNNNNNN